jgi:hypothetical protein
MNARTSAATGGRPTRRRFHVQLHYSSAQLERAYPEIGAFFRAKRQIDPDNLLTNTFYERYAAAVGG